MRAILPRTPGRTPASSTAPALFPTGEIVGRYQVEAVIGLGGTGTVFRCYDKERGAHVAVKAIPHDATLRRRAQREVEVARRLDHPNVVRLLDSARDDDYIYVVSELVDGGDLGASLRAGALGDAALLRAVSATCAGLAHAHAAGIVHRDVKPANILLGGDGTVQLADFGIAMLVGPDATVDDRLLGTLSYMAPEICTGSVPTPAVGHLVGRRDAVRGDDRREPVPRPLACRARGPARRAPPPARRGASRPRPSARRRLRSRALARSSPPPDRGLPGHRLRGGRRSSRGARPLARRRAAPAARARLAAGSQPRTFRGRRSAVPRPRAALGTRGARRVGEHRCAAWACPPRSPSGRARSPGASGPGVAAAVAVEAMLRTFPFWPPSLTTPIALACGGLALVAPWSAAALVIAVCVPGLGNVSSALAWAFALLGALWLVLSIGSGRRALLPALAPAALALLALPRLPDRGRPPAQRARALRGRRSGAARDRDLGRAARAPRRTRAPPTHRSSLAHLVHARGRTARRAVDRAGAPSRCSGRSPGRAGASGGPPRSPSGSQLALVAQAVVPAVLGGVPEATRRSIAAVAAVAILAGLSVPARGDAS